MKNDFPKTKVMAMFSDWMRKGEGYGAVGWYRIVNPMQKLGANIVGKFTMGGIKSALELKEKGDIWWMRPSDASNIDILIETTKIFAGTKLVMDMDDDLLHVDEDHPMKKTLDEKAGIVIRQLQFADRVVVSTEPLKESLKELNDRITVIPNSIDPEIWKVKRKKKKDDIIRIGWTASASHYADIPIIEPPIHEILDKYPNVEFHMIGMIPENLQEDRVFHHEASAGYKEFPQFLADFNFDIAVAPCKDNQFNRCKSNIKWLEFSMLGIPVVASDVYPYSNSIEHGKTGYIAKNKNQWVKHLSWLIESEELRRKIAKNAKEEVLKNWTIDKFLPKYQEIIDDLGKKRDITVITAIAGGKDELLKQPKSDRAEYVAFMEDGHSEDWIVKPICKKFIKPVMNAKIHKILAHKYCDTNFIVTIDGNLRLKVKPEELIKYLGDNDIATLNHPGRDDIFDEAEACVAWGKGDRLEIAEQVRYYAERNYKRHQGLRECGLIIRRNTPEVNALFEKWWSEVCRFSERDQISFPWVFDLKNVSKFPGQIKFDKDSNDKNFLVEIVAHKK